MRFVVFDSEVCGLVNYNLFLPNHILAKFNQTAHPVFRVTFQFFCLQGTNRSHEPAPNDRSRTPNRYSGYSPVQIIQIDFIAMELLLCDSSLSCC